MRFWKDQQVEDFHCHARKTSVSQETTSVLVAGSRFTSTYRRKSRRDRSKVLTIVSLNSALVLLSLTVAYYENQRYYNNGYQGDQLTVTLRVSNLLLSAAQILLVFQYYRALRRLELSRRLRVQEEMTGLELTAMCGECLVHCLALPPYCDHVWTFSLLGIYAKLTLDDVFLLTHFLRLVHWLRLLVWKSRFTDERSFLHIRLQSVPHYSPFITRSMFKLYPNSYLLGIWSLVSLACGACLQAVERGAEGSKIYDFYSAVWGIIVPEATIGYGDCIPSTHAGRLIVLLAVLVGTGLLSSLLIIVVKLLILTPAETGLYLSMVQSQTVRERLHIRAVVLIQRWWRLVRGRKAKVPRLRLTYNWHRYLADFSRRLRKTKALKDVPFRTDLEEISPVLESHLSSLRSSLDLLRAIKPNAGKVLTSEFAIAHKVKLACRSALEDVPPSRMSSMATGRRSTGRRPTSISAKIREMQSRRSALTRIRRMHKDVTVVSGPSRKEDSSSHSQDD